MDSLESNQKLRLLAVGTGRMSELPTQILMMSTFSSCSGVPNYNEKFSFVVIQFEIVIQHPQTSDMQFSILFKAESRSDR